MSATDGSTSAADRFVTFGSVPPETFRVLFSGTGVAFGSAGEPSVGVAVAVPVDVTVLPPALVAAGEIAMLVVPSPDPPDPVVAAGAADVVADAGSLADGDELSAGAAVVALEIGVVMEGSVVSAPAVPAAPKDAAVHTIVVATIVASTRGTPKRAERPSPT